jgi:hypothetical protein
MIALSGVRSSWLMLATNCDLCWLAISSWWLLSWISSNSRTFSIAITAWSAKRRNQLDLFVGERLNGGSDQRHDANRGAFAHERNAEHGASATELEDLGERKFWIIMDVMDMNGFSFEQRSADTGTSPRLLRKILQRLLMFRRGMV